MRTDRRQRHQIIKKIIEKMEIANHLQLLKELRKMGIRVNQPTISRDLRELGVIKAAKGLRRSAYQLPAGSKGVGLEELRYKLAHLVEDVRHTGSLILVKVPPGEAQALARVLDDARLDHVLGTVAGDDTILIVVDTKGGARKVLGIIGQERKIT
jgi:transcriptional regulator of arginine metabolism